MMKKRIVGLILVILISMALVIHILSRKLLFARRSRRKMRYRVAMIGTFESPGWLLAHVGPLAACSAVEEVCIVCTDPFNIELPKIRFYCPSHRIIALMGRRMARIVTVLKLAMVKRPQVYMGYHIMPNALYALLLARLFGGRAIYQMTGGPIQIIGGGYQSENPLLAATETSSKILEYFLFSLVRCFDIVIVRGKKALDFVKKQRLAKQCYIITGAIDTEIFKPSHEQQDIDILYVGRLVSNKGVEYCIEVVKRLSVCNPAVQFGIAGDGPMEKTIKQFVQKAHIEKNVIFLGKITNMVPVLRRAKIFLLLSQSEGMSIAMLEAMACGLPVVVSKVGDLEDAFEERAIGLLVNRLNSDEIARRIDVMLQDNDLLSNLSRNARKTIATKYSVDVMAGRWQKILSYE